MDIEILKQLLRVKSKNFDADINILIETVKKDLQSVGVAPSILKKDNDPLINRAIITFAKAEFGLDNPNSEKLLESYEHQKGRLSLMGEYTNEL